MVICINAHVIALCEMVIACIYICVGICITYYNVRVVDLNKFQSSPYTSDMVIKNTPLVYSHY